VALVESHEICSSCALSWRWFCCLRRVDPRRGGRLPFAQGLASEFEAMQVLSDSVHHSVGDGRFSERLVPVGDRQLTGEDGGAQPGPVFDDLQSVGGLIGRQRPQGKIVDLLRILDKSTYPDLAIIPMGAWFGAETGLNWSG
jgi:hypothetical protein